MEPARFNKSTVPRVQAASDPGLTYAEMQAEIYALERCDGCLDDADGAVLCAKCLKLKRAFLAGAYWRSDGRQREIRRSETLRTCKTMQTNPSKLWKGWINIGKNDGFGK